ncbi:MAG TPA: serine/threonine-protein kinase [Pyrinomonadaceae bacterium]|nr:serine/threonine-protein kinase [Pyrinomonadaceae bacterium]
MSHTTTKNRRLIVEIFDEIFDAPTIEREKILQARCGADSALRGEVEKMLSAVETDDDFLEEPMFEDAFSVFGQEANGNLIGQKLDKYILRELIGQGGMGAVYLGERSDDEYRQKVAIKLISSLFTDKSNSENFRRERQILAKLNHPSIAGLLDGGTLENGTPFLVMEYVEGVSLTEFCAEKKPSIKELLKLFLEVCEAVKFAHQNLIIHRDLKPANILVTAEGKPKLLDFGVAKLLRPELLDITTDFTVGANILTPNYASPEQLKGENITTASDVYSLGVILYEILTGKRPHDLKSKTLPEILKAITEEIPKFPSDALSENPQSAIPNPQSLKGDIDTILLKSLAKDARERYQTVDEFCADIVRYLNDLPILARKPSKVYQLKKFVRRNKVAVISGCVIFLLLSTLLGTAIYSARVAQRQAYENLRQAYSSDMNLAIESYETANLVRLGQILEKYKDVDFRGWEYGFLQNLANPKGRIATLQHSAEVWNVAFSPDSRKMATACGDGFARIYEVPSGKLLIQTTQEKNIWRVRFSPDGKFLATASGDSASSSAKIWNAETGAEILSLVGHTARVRAIDFSPDGKTIATGSYDGTIRIWNAETGAELKKFTFQNDGRFLETHDLRFSRDGTKLLSATTEFALIIEIASGKNLLKVNDINTWHSITLSPDGKRFAVGASTSNIRIYETNTGKMLSEIKENAGRINNLAFSPDGKFILAASSDRTIRFFETDSGTEVNNLRVHFADAWSVDFSADGKFIATAGTDFNVFLFDAEELQKSSSFGYQANFGGTWATISADRKIVALPNYLQTGVDQTVWDVETKSQKFVFLSGNLIDSGTFSPDGAVLATGMRDSKITFWNTADGAQIRSFQAHVNREPQTTIHRLTFSPDGKRLVSGGADNLVKIWNAETDELIRDLWRFENRVGALGISPDGKRIFASSYDLSAKLFDAETGEVIADLDKQTKAIISVAFAPDGKTFATGGADSIIKIWQTSDGKRLETITGNAGFINALTFTPDGKRLASASGDGVIRLWDMETQAQVLAIRTNSAITNFLAFTPDGKTLISHGTQEKVHLWESLEK